MIVICKVCGYTFDKAGHLLQNFPLVPKVCSSECFKELLIRGDIGYPLEFPSELVRENPEGKEASFRSKYESEFAEWLSENHIHYLYEPLIFKVGKSGCYLPDFYLDSHEIFIEVKGRWEGGAFSKFRSFVSAYPGYPIFLADKAFLKRIGIKNI